MSAAALRRPARWHHALRAELGRTPSKAALVWPVILVVFGSLGANSVYGNSSSDGPFSEVRMVAALMFFFPLIHWPGGAGTRSRWTVVPMHDRHLELIRIACGAVWAALVLALMAGAYTVMLNSVDTTLLGLPRSYPVSLCIMGVAYYLLGSAVVARTERPWRVMIVLFILGGFVLARTGVWVETLEFKRRWGSATGSVITATTDLTLAGALLRLGVAAAAVLLSASLRGVRRPAWLAWRVRRSHAAIQGAPVAAALLRVPRQPPSDRTIALRQFSLQAPWMRVMLLLAGVAALWEVWQAMHGRSTFLTDGGPLAVFAIAAFLWPGVVWLEEGRGRDWDRAQPVAGFRRALLHALAGLVWVQAAALLLLAGCVAGALYSGALGSIAGVPASVLVGVLLSTFALYCLGTLWAVSSRNPIGGVSIGLMLTAPVIMMISEDERVPAWAPSRAVAGFIMNGTHLTLTAALIWIPLMAGLAVAALYSHAGRSVRATGATPAKPDARRAAA